MLALRPSKILCVGRNYRAHAAELGNDVPAEPLLFFKPPSALISAGEAIVLPPQSSRVEHEGEIAVVLGRSLRHATPDEARAAISYVLPLNDVTARDLQRTDGQWTRAKGFDTFCPVGSPVPAQEVDLEALEVITTVDGEVRQHGYASDMAFSIPDVVAYASAIMTLEAGDLITTGTPEGVGPLEPGMTVTVEIPGVGSVSNPVAAARS
ncbi:fumarylacetoacetate hydrolase family protein [Gaopeijia maritima]|uniref:Fumarylacetoacetate hydrolase family protein n=1 Tax=Gaopeijia maritima TaxID=3119007 RepID=A0ABU9E754_9BACT